MSLTILEVKKKHEASLLAIKGVISVGIGLNTEKVPSIIVGIERSDSVIISRIPSTLENYPVEIQIIGSIRAQ